MLELDDFSGRLGREFQLTGRCGQFTATLTECQAIGSNGFSLLFTAGPAAPMEQDSYLVAGADFDPEPIFLVPVSTDGQVVLQAVFNRLPD